MGQTDIYDLPWPELGDPSDGPDGYQDLALATEAALKGLRDNAEDIAFTPSWRSSGSIQPYGMAWNARYSVRGGRCFVNAFGQMQAASTSGGTGFLLVGLPVRTRASFAEQMLTCKLYVWGYSFIGWAYAPPNSTECIPYFPVDQDHSHMGGWMGADSSGDVGRGLPNLPGRYSVGDGNFSLWGSYLV
jgi:hypothetical protein